MTSRLTVSLPIIFWLWVLLVAFGTLFIVLNTASFAAAFLIATSLSVVFYLMFVAKAAVIALRNDSIEFKYFSPLLSDVVVDFESVTSIKLELSYFFLFDVDSQLGRFDLIHPYDSVIFEFSDGTIRTIHFNSNYFGTMKLLRTLRRRFPSDSKNSL